eukprot:scaffold717_cov101-Isochrysis_galbana.AAC.2
MDEAVPSRLRALGTSQHTMTSKQTAIRRATSVRARVGRGVVEPPPPPAPTLRLGCLWAISKSIDLDLEIWIWRTPFPARACLRGDAAGLALGSAAAWGDPHEQNTQGGGTGELNKLHSLPLPPNQPPTKRHAAGLQKGPFGVRRARARGGHGHGPRRPHSK